jgi:hypothetical protein
LPPADTLPPDTGTLPVTIQHAWSQVFGGNGDDVGYGVALDPTTGNVHVAGSTTGGVDFGGGALPANGSYEDIFVASFTPSGAHRWSRVHGSVVVDRALDVAVDPGGNVFVTGTFSGQADFGGAPIPANGQTILLASYDAGGAHRWSQGFGAAGSDVGMGVGLDSQSNVYIAGYCNTAVDFGGGPLTTQGYDAFVASFANNGVHRWSETYGSSASEMGYDLAVDDIGRPYVGGFLKGQTNFGGNTLSSCGTQGDIFTLALSSAGAHRWSEAFCCSGQDFAVSVAVTGSGEVYYTGYFGGTIDFGGGALASPASSSDIFVASFDSFGGHRWSKRFGGTLADVGRSVAVDQQGNVYVTGYFYDVVDFGGGPLPSVAGTSDIFVASFDSTGAHRWSGSFGGAGVDRAHSVAVDSGGAVYVTGEVEGSVDFGGGPITAKAGKEIFLLKLKQVP